MNSNGNEPPISENRSTKHSNNTEQTLTHGKKINLENNKRIMNGKRTTLTSIRNIDWRTIKTEIETID